VLTPTGGKGNSTSYRLREPSSVAWRVACGHITLHRTFGFTRRNDETECTRLVEALRYV